MLIRISSQMTCALKISVTFHMLHGAWEQQSIRDPIKSLLGPAAFFRKPWRLWMMRKYIQWRHQLEFLSLMAQCGLKVKNLLEWKRLSGVRSEGTDFRQGNCFCSVYCDGRTKSRWDFQRCLLPCAVELKSAACRKKAAFWFHFGDKQVKLQ